MLKVLHLFNELKFSGAEIMYVKAAKLFQAQGVDMLACSTGEKIGDFGDEFVKNNITVFHKPIKSGIHFSIKSIQYYYNFYHFLKTEKINVLHIHRSDLFMAAFCARLAGIKTIKTMHNVFRNRELTLPYGILLRFIARTIFNVQFQTIGESVYNNELNYYKNPSVLVNNWYDSENFYPKLDEIEKNIVREKLGINKNAFVVVSVGGCSEIKNHADILRSVLILQKKIDILYLHLGCGLLEKKEKVLSMEFGINESVNFLGNKNNVREYLIASDVYVMTSKHEGLSIAAIEAMACGLPSILYNSPGLRDLIKDDDNGFLIEPDHIILAEKIIKFYSDIESMTEKGSSAICFVNKNFSMKNNVAKIISLYKDRI